MDNRLLQLIMYLKALPLCKADRKIIQELHEGWKERYGNYQPDISETSIQDVVNVYNSLVRERADFEQDNLILAQVIENLLAEKSKM